MANPYFKNLKHLQILWYYFLTAPCMSELPVFNLDPFNTFIMFLQYIWIPPQKFGFINMFVIPGVFLQIYQIRLFIPFSEIQLPLPFFHWKYTSQPCSLGMTSGNFQWYTISLIKFCQYSSSPTYSRIISVIILSASTCYLHTIIIIYIYSYSTSSNLLVVQLVFCIHQQCVASILLILTILLLLIVNLLPWPSNDQIPFQHLVSHQHLSH